MKHCLEADGIQLEFNGRRILSGIYIKCDTGKITGLLGRNGQGKSCLMNIIYGTLDAEKSIRFDGAFRRKAFKRPDLLAYLPQFNFIPKSLSLKRIFADFALDYAMFLQWFPEFEPSYRLPIDELSGGGRRLVELYTIVTRPSKFAMLDEPFSHLSPLQIEKVKGLLLAEKENKGLLITDHMYQHILDVSDDLYVLANGRTELVQSQQDIERLGYINW
jgi:ABC-type lipopolysaccharide export system ATPase subunit